MASGDLSKAEQNYTCCAKACVDFMKLPLVDILNNQIKPGDLYNKINSSSTLKLGKNKLRTDQLKLCFLPPPHIPDYSKFDVTLLYTLIRNLCPSLKPTRGWGLEPDALHITIGDDIERLRLFRNNFVHGESTEIPDYEFRALWSNIKDVSQRIHTYTKTWSHYNYKEELSRIASLKFGYEDRDMYQSCFEAMRMLWKQSQSRDEPDILIKGAEKVICGETAQFDAEVKRTETSKWSVTWQTKTGNTTTNIKSSDEKFKGSNDRRLIIHSVCKADEAEYQAVLYNGNNSYVYSNTIYLHVSGEYPFFDNWNITTGTEGLNIHYSYGVPDTSPSVFEVQWTKDGKSLELTSPKYIGGELNDSCLTITSPTLEDKGNYLCKVANTVGTVSKNVLLDVPYATISTDSKVVFGLRTMVKSIVSSCPPLDGVEWQNSNDGKTFRRIDINKTHYYGSSLIPESPVLAIPYTTFDDMLHYRLLVWNKIGDQYSNTLYLNVTGSLPNVMTNHEICLKEHSVKLIGKVFPHKPEHVFWTKNGEKIDTSKSGEKYSEVTVEDPSLIIFKANEHDAGSYQLIATNAVGSTHSEVIVLDKAQIDFERRENPDGKQIFKATIESTPAAYYAEWKIKGKDDLTFTPVKNNAEDLKGTSNSLPYPVLVIKHRELLENKRFLLEVDNFVGNSVKEISCSEISQTSCRTEVDILSDIASTRGSKIRFNNLRLNLVEGLAERDLQNLKTSLEVLTPIGKEFLNVNSISDFISSLWKKNVFQERNVIIMQYLMRSLKRRDLEQMCVKYAIKDKQALCYFEAPLNQEGLKVYLHVVDNIENFTKLEALLQTVACIVDCAPDEIKVIGLRPENSFIIIITMTANLLIRLKKTNPMKLRKLSQYKVDWIEIEDKIINIHEAIGYITMATPDKTFIVAAIDFGTTFSGYAYSLISDHKKDPLKIYSPTWKNDGNGTQKTPTSILFDDKGEFHSFGYEAEKKYSDLAAANELDEDEDNESDEDYRNWFYFRRFKMALFRAASQGGRPKGKKIKEDMQITAANGKKMSALKVFSEAIRYLKEQLDKELEKCFVEDHEAKSTQQESWADHVRWVLTVPAIWSNEAKQFMRMAAVQAGIANNQLKLALEPEAAAILCKQVALSKDKEESEVKAFQPGRKFMVVDCGGGTVDVTAHEVVGGGGLKELHHATGDALGGTNVDRKFFSAMTEWLGEDVMKRFEKESTSDWLEFERNFESKKRSIGRSDEEYITFSNLGELCRIYKELKGSSVKSRMTECKLEGKVSIVKENKFRFKTGFLKDLVYRETMCDLVSHLEKLFLNMAVSEIRIILLVGGFSECPILYDKIKDTFPKKVIINPAEANLAVLKGAVIFGHEPASITERRSPKYYGIATNAPFKTGVHPESYKLKVDGMDVCTDVFKCMIEKNAPLTRIQKTFTLSPAYSTSGNIEVYESDKLKTFTTECRMLGTVVLDVKDYKFQDKKREIDVSLEFGSTELYVFATDKSTDRTVTGKFVCLNK